MLFYGNFKRKLDKYGKVIIPRQLRGSLEGETVVVAGCKDHIEIWTQRQWADEQSKMRKVLDRFMK